MTGNVPTKNGLGKSATVKYAVGSASGVRLGFAFLHDSEQHIRRDQHGLGRVFRVHRA